MMRTSSLKRKTPLRSRSIRMTHLYAKTGGRRELVARLLLERPRCEAGARIRATLPGHACQTASRDVHELLPRSAGGSLLDEANLICVCRVCHGWIHRHPRESMCLGFKQSRYTGDAS